MPTSHHHPAHEHHHHHHHHAHRPGPGNRAFAWGIGLNVALVVVQVVYGLIAHSLALLADAGHNLSDVMGLVIAWLAAMAARRRPTVRLSYGLRATSIWAALFNAVLILVACGAIAWEAIERLSAPHAVNATIVLWVAALGALVNGVSAWFFHSHASHDLNARGAYLHLLGDAAVSLGVVVGALVIAATGWYWVDPALSLAVVAVIVLTTWRLFRESLHLALGGVPLSIDPVAVRKFLATRAQVADVHDLHVWAMSTTEVALTAHLVMPNGHPGDGFLRELAHDLEQRFGIHHATIQIERGELACGLAPDSVV
jgi:cobalt-zinc-cadmium efflux system protein